MYRKAVIYRHSQKPYCYTPPHAENVHFLSYDREKNNAVCRHEQLTQCFSMLTLSCDPLLSPSPLIFALPVLFKVEVSVSCTPFSTMIPCL